MKKFDAEVRLSREMTLMDVTLIGVGAMIGAGIFVLTGIAAGVAGPALIIAFALNGLVALLTAMAYAELGSCYHDAGGGYLWVKEGLPKWNGFLSGWMSWFAHAVACSLYALGFGAYFDHVLHEFGWGLPNWGFLSPQKLLAAAIALIFAYINFRGASETGKIGNMVTIAKIVILAIFIAFGLELILRKGNIQEAFTPFFANGWGGVIKAMGLTFIAFQGFEVISQCSEEVKNPRRNIPRAVFLSLVIVVPIYLLVAVVSLGSVSPENMTPWDYLASHKETALVEVSKTFFVGGGVMLLVGGIISTMSALNATVYSSSRVAFAMGRDRNFPGFFAKVHTKKFTPYWAILVSLVIIVGISVSLHIEDVASAADIMFLLLFLQVNIAMIRLRKKRPDLDRGYVTPVFPYLSIIGILLLLFLAIFMFTYSPIAWIITSIWIGAGLGVYYTYSSKREIAHVKRVRALEAIEKKEYRILVPIANPASVRSLSEVAIAVARKHNAEIIFVHVIEVREDQPLLAGLEIEAKGRVFLEQAMLNVPNSSVPIRSILKVSHRISGAIVETAEEENCNFIILGRVKNPTVMGRFLSSIIDSVIQDSPCEVGVLHGELPRKGVKKILVPYGQDIHTQLVLEMLPAFTVHFKAEASIGVVFEPFVSQEDRQRRLEQIQAALNQNNLSHPVETAFDRGIRQGVVQMSATADLIIMSGRSGDFLELLLRRSLVQEITEDASCPVLWVKEYEEKRSFWKSLLTPQGKEEVEHHG